MKKVINFVSYFLLTVSVILAVAIVIFSYIEKSHYKNSNVILTNKEATSLVFIENQQEPDAVQYEDVDMLIFSGLYLEDVY